MRSNSLLLGLHEKCGDKRQTMAYLRGDEWRHIKS